MTTKLIQELAGLAVEKGIRFEYDWDNRALMKGWWFTIYPLGIPEVIYASHKNKTFVSDINEVIDRIRKL